MNQVTPQSELCWGTVGWVDDGGTFYDQGSAQNDGATLLRVTLFDGRDPSMPLDQSQAQGRQLVAKIAAGVFRIPKRGTRVLVAVPGKFGGSGGALVIATDEPSPNIQFSLNRVVIDYGPDVHVVIKGKSVSMQSHSTPAQFVSVGIPASGGTPGVYALDETGSGFATQQGEVAIFSCDGSGNVQSTCHLTNGVAELLNKGSQTCGVQAKSGDCNAFGANFKCTTGKVYLGNPALMTVLTNGVAIGPQPGANSTAVFAAAT